MSEPYECLCLHCGLTYWLPAADLVLERPPDADHTVANNLFCDQCGGVLAVLGAETGGEPDDWQAR